MYPEAGSVSNIQSSTVAQVLIDFISRHGVMQTLCSGCGSNFMYAAMNEVYNIIGISKLQTLAYDPQADVVVERLNKTLIEALSDFISVKQADWSQHILLALNAFRNSIIILFKKLLPSFLCMVEIFKGLIILFLRTCILILLPMKIKLSISYNLLFLL
ncbi:reverse transcriptase [Caerostris extrusa]|uniref:Reverse transcriptase n=1 Tax=Caerostris extrusa TaxID=172846 RepID=A0AAV4Y9C0_CAEEX|nr:reverse transcriptase [Caerostris extrusa]